MCRRDKEGTTYSVGWQSLAYCTSLLKRRGLKTTGGSNPSPTANFMATKELQPEQLKGFLTYMDYAATGEGRTVEINFCLVSSEDEAREKHLDRFVGKDESSRNYFGVGVDVSPIESEKAKELLQNVFKFGDNLHKNLVEAGIEFYFKCYVNYS